MNNAKTKFHIFTNQVQTKGYILLTVRIKWIIPKKIPHFYQSSTGNGMHSLDHYKSKRLVCQCWRWSMEGVCWYRATLLAWRTICLSACPCTWIPAASPTCPCTLCRPWRTAPWLTPTSTLSGESLSACTSTSVPRPMCVAPHLLLYFEKHACDSCWFLVGFLFSFLVFVYLLFQGEWGLLCQELTMDEDNPHTQQDITAFIVALALPHASINKWW